MKSKTYVFSLVAVLSLLLVNVVNARGEDSREPIDPFWQGATVYFMMTDRFKNGNPANDRVLNRGQNGAVMRNFMGGDIQGITDKINDGYFSDLGVDVLWMTPLNEQIHGYWQDDWGDSYPFHGYWPKDWTSVDPNFGTEEQMREMIDAAHSKGIRVLADIILNHTGPKTELDKAWPDAWIRTRPLCDWKKHNFENTVRCALSPSLTDIRTESELPVTLPPFLLEKWEKEGRLMTELEELDSFFKRTRLPKAPKNYLIKWVTDWVRDYGIDGFRVDTAKHIEPAIWSVVKKEASSALSEWRLNHPDKMIDKKPFLMMGEVFEFGLDGFRYTPKGTSLYDYGDVQVDFYDYGFDSLINMSFASHASKPMPELFQLYADELRSDAFIGKGVLNYLVSHDDPEPYDRERKRPYEAALKLMLAPGAAQIYYGDELARPLFAKGAIGDAHWRVPMNWSDLHGSNTQALLRHWQKLGQFRQAHRSIAIGHHRELQAEPYIFARQLKDKNGLLTDSVLVALGLNLGEKQISVYGVYEDGSVLKDGYSGHTAVVENGKIAIKTDYSLLLLSEVDVVDKS